MRLAIAFALLVFTTAALAEPRARNSKPRDVLEWARHNQLAQRLGCAHLLRGEPALGLPAPSPTTTPRLVIYPYPEEVAYPVSTILQNIDEKNEFLIGWEPRQKDSFLYKVRVRKIDGQGADSTFATDMAVQSHRLDDSAVALLQFLVDDGGKLEHDVITQTRKLTVSVEDTDIRSALANHGSSTIRSLSVWIYHPNANPPLESEVADLKTAAQIEMKGRMKDGFVTLHVVGPYDGGFVQYIVKIPLS